ncbi:MAG: sigma-54 dependent transcriptional regulator [Chitinophagaceae bacterium]
MKRILLIDDDMDMCTLLGRFLQRKGFETEAAYSGNKGIAKFKEQHFDVVLCDFRLGDKEGREVLKEIKEINPQAVVIIITGYSDIKIAVDVIKHGAFDYITKPLIPEEVLNVINKSLQEPAPSSANVPGTKKNSASSANDGEFLRGQAAATKELYKQIELVAPTNYSIILYGESGTGKEVMAKTIHLSSARKDKPFVALDCGTLSKELVGSELFGHMKGSFTGALGDKEGLFEVANGGTLFLDEVANLSLDIQASLLRVIQERKFKRVGGNKEISADVRILVASNENLQEAYRKGKFREDLYHRFNEFSVNIPPLRERKDDIPLFANFFLKQSCAELNKEITGFEDEVMQMFVNYSWPGNLREFRNVIRRAALLTSGGLIGSKVLPWEMTQLNPLKDESFVTSAAIPVASPVAAATDVVAPVARPTSFDLKNAASQAEYETIMNVLKQVNFNKSKAADILKIDRKTLYNKLRVYESHQHNGE